MRIVSAGHAVFAALMIGIGIQGLTTGEFTTVWQPVPKGAPAREVLAYLCALLSLASGIGNAARKLDQYAAQKVIHLRGGYSTPIDRRRFVLFSPL